MIFLSYLFGISNAYAADATAQAGGSLMSMLPILIIFVVLMYFLIIRPQSKRAKEQRELISSLKKGDEVITGGGVLGKIVKVTDNFIVVTVAQSVDLTIQKSAVVTVVPKGTVKSIE